MKKEKKSTDATRGKQFSPTPVVPDLSLSTSYFCSCSSKPLKRTLLMPGVVTKST